jgi:hypothetical protein
MEFRLCLSALANKEKILGLEDAAKLAELRKMLFAYYNNCYFLLDIKHEILLLHINLFFHTKKLTGFLKLFF